MKQMASLLLAAITALNANDVLAATLDDRLAAMGFVDVKSVHPEIMVDLMYAKDTNFVGKVMYTSLTGAYLHPQAAEALKKAAEALAKEERGLRLKVCDAARPMSVQRTMYQAVRGTSKARYVSNPANGGGLHNYGLAVDITIADSTGVELDMGTPVDYLGSEANIDKEERLVATGRISPQARRNRELLRKVMAAGGWMPLKSEWWHFNLRTRAQAKARYKRLDF